MNHNGAGNGRLVAVERHLARSSELIERLRLVAADGPQPLDGCRAIVTPNAAVLSAEKVALPLARMREVMTLAGPTAPFRFRLESVELEEPAPPVVSDETALRLLERLPLVLGRAGPCAAEQGLETDLGLDSLDLVTVRLLLAEEFGVEVPDEDLWRLRTVGDLMARVSGKAHRPAKIDYSWSTRVAEPAAVPLDVRFNLGRRGVNKFFAELGMSTLTAGGRLAFLTELVHAERLPATGPYLLCPNHRSFLDSVLLYGIFPKQLVNRTVFLAFGAYFHTPPGSWLVRMGRLILTGGGDSITDSLRLGVDALRRGRITCIFPEGVRSPSGEIGVARPGVGILACEGQAPIVPVLYQGTENVFSPRVPGFQLTKVRAIVGHPIPPPPPKAFGRPDYQAMAERWREGVQRLVDEHEGTPRRRPRR